MSRGADSFKSLTREELALARPSLYLGSNPTARVTRDAWTYSEDGALRKRVVELPWGCERIYTDALQNVSDAARKGRAVGMKKIPPASISIEEKRVSVSNGGSVITVENSADGRPLIQILFCDMGSSDNFDAPADGDTPVLGMMGLGAKLFSLYSTASGVTIADGTLSQSLTTQHHLKVVNVASPVKSKERRISIWYELDNSMFDYGDRYDDTSIDCFRAHALFTAITSNLDIKFSASGRPEHTISPIDIRALASKAFHSEHKPLVGALWKHKTRYYADRPADLPATTLPLVEYVVFFTPTTGDFISCLNGGLTIDGGKHVDAVVKAVSDVILGAISSDRRLTAAIIKPHLSGVVFLNDTDKNVNGNAKTRVEAFATKIKLTPAATKTIKSWPLKETLLPELQKSADKVDAAPRRSAYDCEDYDNLIKANYARIPRSKRPDKSPVVLIIAEGKSARNTLIRYTENDRNHYSIYSSRGKPINLTASRDPKALQNKEMAEILDILNLNPHADYSTPDARDTIRYDRIELADDTDADGFNIKTLTLGNLYALSPTLCRHPGFVAIDLFPIVLVELSKGTKKRPPDHKAFYSMSVFEAWKATQTSLGGMKIKYAKGLGSFNLDEVAMMRARGLVIKQDVVFDEVAGDTLEMAHGPNSATYHKELLASYSFERDVGCDTGTSLRVSDIVPEYLARYAFTAVKRAIPSIDGFKESGLKIVSCAHTKLHTNKSMLVEAFGGSVKELMGYHPGLPTLYDSIGNFTRSYAGTQNIPLLVPDGAFADRILAIDAQARYLNTHKSPLWDLLFPHDLVNVVDRVIGDTGLTHEYEHFAQTIPLILCNGAKGPSFGWNTLIYPTNPLEVYDRLVTILKGDPRTHPALKPWFRHYKGTVSLVSSSLLTTKEKESALDNEVADAATLDESERDADADHAPADAATTNEEAAVLAAVKDALKDSGKKWGRYSMITCGAFRQVGKIVEVTEIPINYTASRYEKLLKEYKKLGVIENYDNNCAKETVSFKLYGMTEPSIEKLRLKYTRILSNMNLFIDGRIVHFETYEEILDAFVEHTLRDYAKRLARERELSKQTIPRAKHTSDYLNLITSHTIDVYGKDYDERIDLCRAHGVDYTLVANIGRDDTTRSAVAKFATIAAQEQQNYDRLCAATPQQLWLDDLAKLRPHLESMVQ